MPLIRCVRFSSNLARPQGLACRGILFRMDPVVDSLMARLRRDSGSNLTLDRDDQAPSAALALRMLDRSRSSHLKLCFLTDCHVLVVLLLSITMQPTARPIFLGSMEFVWGCVAVRHAMHALNAWVQMVITGNVEGYDLSSVFKAVRR